jgi:flagellin
MAMVINTNTASINAQRSLATSQVELNTAMERLSSGKRINSASDDAAGFAIAERMTAQIRGLNMAAKNAQDALAMMATAENATNDVTDMLQRIRELAVQGANDTNSAKDRDYLQNEVDALLTEINRVSTQTRYNNLILLDGQRSGSIQVGTEASQTIDFRIESIDTDYLGLSWELGSDGKRITEKRVDENGANVLDADGNKIFDNVLATGATGAVSNGSNEQAGTVNGLDTATIGRIDLSDADSAAVALNLITAAIEKVATDRAGYGALQNRLEYTVSNLMNVSEYTQAARSRIEDADFAVESARLAKAQVLQQSSTAMLAQANASSQLALQLVK